MHEYEEDTLYRPETKNSDSLVYKIGQTLAVLRMLDGLKWYGEKH